MMFSVTQATRKKSSASSANRGRYDILIADTDALPLNYVREKKILLECCFLFFMISFFFVCLFLFLFLFLFFQSIAQATRKT